MKFCGHCGAAAGADAPTDVSETLRSFVAQPVAERLVEAGGELPDERRLITALFADVSGFTALADRLDPEQLLEVIDPVISRLSSVVGRYEGYVEKFAGDALLALYGAPVSHEDDPERALLSALEMHRELAALCSELPYDAELTLHCGVNSGHGIARILGSEARMDYAVLGDSVILAQRLESAAPKGETYVSDLTYRLTADRFEFTPVGELTLKGKSEPVLAWRLIGERVGARAAIERALVGRSRELDAIATTLGRAREGAGAVVQVLGEPGVGKSRLAAAVREHAESEGFRWLDTRCLSYGAGIAYWPYAELLRRVLQLGDATDPDDTVGSLRRVVSTEAAIPFFARLLGLPAASEDVDALEPEAFRRGLHDAFGRWFSDLASHAPLVVAVEDVHWADTSSLELTRELAVASHERAIVLLLMARLDGATALEELLTGAHSIRLEPLDEHEIAALVAQILEGGAPPALLPWVVERTTGNPFFVEELLRALRERGTLVPRQGGWALEPGWADEEVPPTVEGLLASRIDMLPRPATQVLRTASVIGRVVPVPLLDAVFDGTRLGEGLDTLVERGLVDPQPAEVPTVAFHHALVQDVAYSRLLRRQRRDLHRRVAEAAEEMFGAGDDVIELLARHLYLGEGGPKAVEYLVRAGARAKHLFANEEAIVHFQHVVELAPERTELQLELADLYELVGKYDSALDGYGAIRDSRPSEVQAWAGMASTLRKRGAYDQALEVVEDALRSSDLRVGDLSPIRLQQGWTLSVAGRFDEAIDALEAGLGSASEPTEGVSGHILLQLARAETVEGHLDRALAHATEAEAIFAQSDDKRGLGTTMRLLGDLHRNRGELDEAARILRSGFDLSVRTGNIEEIGGCLINLALVELEREDVEESIACSRRAIAEFERIGHTAGLALGYGGLSYGLSRAGEYEEALEHATHALDLAQSIGNALAAADIRDTMSEILLGQQRYAEAALEADEAASQFLQMGAGAMATKALGVAAEAWTKAGEPERARSSEERARAVASA